MPVTVSLAALFGGPGPAGQLPPVFGTARRKPMEITRNQFLAYPERYLHYSSGDCQVTILDDYGLPWIVLGRGPQTEATAEELAAHEQSIQEILDKCRGRPEPTGSWFD